jgi:DNA-binding NarL/FixJ family response regulator
MQTWLPLSTPLPNLSMEEEVMECLRVLIADDHPVFRNGMRTLLASLPEVVVVGEATSGAEAISLATTEQLDVIVMDLQMPGVDGIAASR